MAGIESLDALSILSHVISLVSGISFWEQKIRRKPSPRKPRLSPHCFLEVWDVPASNGNPGNGVPSTKLTSVRFETDLTQAVGSLPQQASGTVRIYIVELDWLTMTGFIKNSKSAILPFHLRLLRVLSDSSNSSAGLRALISQWRGARPNGWYRLEGLDFLGPIESDKTKSPAQHSQRSKMSDLKRDVRELVGISDQQWAPTVKNLRLEDRDGRLGIFIFTATGSHKLIPKHMHHPCHSTEAFASELLALESTYLPLRSGNNTKQLFLLQYHHANLLLFTDFLQRVSVEYTHRRQMDINPRQTKLRKWNLNTIMIDTELYRQFSVVGTELQAMIELLSDVVLALAEGDGHSNLPTRAKLSVLRAELNCCCRNMEVRLDKLNNDLEQAMKFLSLSRDVSQSSDVQTLTLLATIFLPLSLSAGVLSMQYRFHELGERLYDFFGIVVLLVAIVVLLVIGISMRNLVLELEGRFLKHDRYRALARPLFLGLFSLSTIVVGLLILVSFIVGMFKDIGLGGKILGWGIFAAWFWPVPVVIVFAGCSLLMKGMSWFLQTIKGAVRLLSTSLSDREKKQKQRDPEKNSAEGIIKEESDQH